MDTIYGCELDGLVWKTWSCWLTNDHPSVGDGSTYNAIYSVNKDDTALIYQLQVLSNERLKSTVKVYHHRCEFGSFQESYDTDTIPLFELDPFEIEDWGQNNMNWNDIVAFARKVESHKMADSDFQEGWINGDKEIVEGL